LNFAGTETEIALLHDNRGQRGLKESEEGMRSEEGLKRVMKGGACRGLLRDLWLYEIALRSLQAIEQKGDDKE